MLSEAFANREAPRAAPLQLRLFGTFALLRADRALPAPRTRKGQWLLTLLLLRTGQPVDRIWLAATLWPDSGDAQARDNLRTCLKDLRHVLGEDAVRLTAPTPRTLAFDAHGAQCDLLAFDAAIARGDNASLEQALALYRGELLEGCDAEWIFLERQRREQAYLEALETLSENALSLPDPERAVHYLRPLVRAEPLRESAWRRLMRALAETGDIAAVTAAYQELRLHLHQALRTAPDEETVAVYRALQQQHREKRHEVHASLLPYPLPPNAPPRPQTSLVGRAAEIETVANLLTGARLVTLTGAGGVGKTRLAIAVAEKVAEDYLDGVHFVDLAFLADPERLDATVAHALGAAEGANRSYRETLLERLERLSPLLILDNCEHLAGACADLARVMLARCPGLRLLCTSRQPLGASGERTWRVLSLTLPPRGELAGVPQGRHQDATDPHRDSEAVRLFVERAAAASSTFRLNPQSLNHIVRICHRLDGIPLPIELAAAWVRALPVEQIAARLEERLDLLRNPNKGAPTRHQTLRATLDWSYALLGEEERRLFRHLGVFVDGWNLEAAEAVCGETQGPPDGVLLHLAALVDASLVVYEERRDTGRYHLLQTTRQYALEQLSLSPEERSLATRRHADYFLQRALALQEQIKATYNAYISELVSEPIQTDRENYLSAWRWWQQEDPEKGIAMMLSLHQIRIAIPWTEAHQWIDRLADSEPPAPSPLQADLYLTAYDWARWLGDPRWRGLLETALALAEGCQDKFLQAAAWHSMGYHEAFHEKNYALGVSYLERAQEDYQRSGYPLRAALTQHHLALAVRLRGEPQEAQRLAEEVLRIGRETGSFEVTCVALRTLGEIAFREEDYARAKQRYEDILLCCPREEDTYVANALRMLGRIAAHQGDFEASRNFLRRSIALYQETREWSNVAWGLEALAQTARQEGDYAAAADELIRAMDVLHPLGESHEWNVTYCLGILAHLAREQDQAERAATLWGFREAMLQRRGWRDQSEDRLPFEAALAALKARMSLEAFDAAWSRGAGMSLPEAIRYARTCLTAPS